MKKWISSLLATALIILTITGCGQSINDSDNSLSEEDQIPSTYLTEQLGPTKEAERLRQSQGQTAEETIADPIAEETIAEPIAEETIADPISETVYITRTGEKYHIDGCRYLSKSQIPIDLSDAQAGYSPCSVCDPPQ